MENPLISIIVPVFNCEKYIKRCVDSILNQTYTNLNVVLVDDASSDRSAEICNEYSALDQRVIVIHKNNRGVHRREIVVWNMRKGNLYLL